MKELFEQGNIMFGKKGMNSPEYERYLNKIRKAEVIKRKPLLGRKTSLNK